MKITAGEMPASTVIKQARTPAYPDISRGRDERVHSNKAGGDTCVPRQYHAGETNAYTVIKQARTTAYPDNITQARRPHPQ